MILSKGFFIVFGILLALPMLMAAAVICYYCFSQLGIAAGFIAIGICLLISTAAAIVIRKKSKNIN